MTGPHGSVGTTTAPDGIPIRFSSAGTGIRTLLFVHGWSCDRTYWKAQVPAFEDRYGVVSVDLAGHGESGAGRAAYTMESFGTDVAAVIDELGLDDAVLIGHSMGGDVIVETALRRPEAVSGLIWVDTYIQLSTPRTPEQVRALVDSFRADFVARTRTLVEGFFPPTADPELVEWIAADMSAGPRDVGLEALERAVSNLERAATILPRLTAPLAAINPDFWQTDVDDLRRHGVRRVEIMAGVGHFPMMEAPDRFNAILDELVATAF